MVLISNQVDDNVRFDLVAQILESHGDQVKAVRQSVKTYFGDP
jgi:hypothetical protein